VVHPVTKETITKYEKLANDPLLGDVWTAAMSKELGRLAQGFNETEGTETIFFMSKDEIKEIPKDRTVTYARILVDYQPQKADPNRVRITVGGNLIDYPQQEQPISPPQNSCGIALSVRPMPNLQVQMLEFFIWPPQWNTMNI
jgi:hypothetical protein